MPRSRPLPVRHGVGRRGKPDPFDVEALEKSLNDAAQRVSTLWISFLIFGLYLVVSAGTVTHRQLLLEEPVKLPVLNIDLPLVGFFFLAPILFVVFHAYMLLQVVLLGRKATAYNEAVERRVRVAADNARMRQRLANALFAQIFAGAQREGDAWLGFLLNAMALITVVIAPVLVLLVFQFKFLPYHSSPVTWTLRILIVIDLALVFVLWPAAKKPGSDIALRGILRRPIALTTAIAVVAFSWVLLSFPGEPHAQWSRYYPSEEEREREIGSEIKCRTKSPISWVLERFDTKWKPARRGIQDQQIAIIANTDTTEIEFALARFDRLNLPGIDVVDDEKLKLIKANTKDAGEKDYQGERTLKLRDRNFDCADLSDYADLRRVDLAGASLRGASFKQSKLKGARLDGVQLQGADLLYAELQGASLVGARLQGASLLLAELQGASLVRAQLQRASLESAQLQGASLAFAQLQGASLVGARLQGASLQIARLQGASLLRAQLQGATLAFAQLQGASLAGAALQGASLQIAQLQGASLVWAQLQGASLESAQLQGALLRSAELQGASLESAALQGAHLAAAALNETVLSKAVVWRARNADCEGARVQGIHFDTFIRLAARDPRRSIAPTPETIAKFIDDAVVGISNPDVKRSAVSRMRAGLVVDPNKDDTNEIAEVWRKCEKAAAKVPQVEFDKKHAALLRDLVCEAKKSRGAIAKGIIRNWIASKKDRRAAQLARGLLGEDGRPCAATADLDKDDIKRLREAIAAAPSPPGAASPSAPPTDAAPGASSTPSGDATAAPAAGAGPSGTAAAPSGTGAMPSRPAAAAPGTAAAPSSVQPAASPPK